MAAGNSDFNEILSTTLKNYVPKLADNVFTARPLFYALTNGQTIRRINGGAKIVVPMAYLDTPKQDPLERIISFWLFF